MHQNPLWVLTVPTLSTIHIPNPYVFVRMREHEFTPVAEYQEGAFVYMQQPENCEGEFAWLKPIAEWAAGLEYEWVRFDSDGDELDIFPLYEW